MRIKRARFDALVKRARLVSMELAISGETVSEAARRKRIQYTSGKGMKMIDKML